MEEIKQKGTNWIFSLVKNCDWLFIFKLLFGFYLFAFYREKCPSFLETEELRLANMDANKELRDENTTLPQEEALGWVQKKCVKIISSLPFFFPQSSSSSYTIFLCSPSSFSSLCISFLSFFCWCIFMMGGAGVMSNHFQTRVWSQFFIFPINPLHFPPLFK